MKIKDVERLTGLSQSNIRFYEEESLISPKRLENNYRDYSEQDVKVLNEIKKLRVLGLPIEQIRSLYQNNASLEKCLKSRLEEIDNQKKNLAEIEEFCKAAIDRHITLDEIDDVKLDEESVLVKSILEQIISTDTYEETVDISHFKKIAITVYSVCAALGFCNLLVLINRIEASADGLDINKIFLPAIACTIAIFILGKAVRNGKIYVVMSVVASVVQSLLITVIVTLIYGFAEFAVTTNYTEEDPYVKQQLLCSKIAFTIVLACLILALVNALIKSRAGNSIALSMIEAIVATVIIVAAVKIAFGGGTPGLISAGLVGFVYAFGTAQIWNNAVRQQFRLSSWYAIRIATDMLNIVGTVLDLRGRYGTYNIRRTREEDRRFYGE